MLTSNQTPEEKARDKIDVKLRSAGWEIQDKNTFNPAAGRGIAFKEFPTKAGKSVDYCLLVNGRPIGVIEAKPDDHADNLIVVETQSTGYADSKLKYTPIENPLDFVFEATGEVIRFTDRRDPKPRARELFNFPQPEALKAWSEQKASLRTMLKSLPELDKVGLRECQIEAICGLEKSFSNDQPRALVQMATGAGKTFTAINSVYRLLKYTNLKRVLFLVDTKNLGKQAEQEFRAFVPNDDNRQFTDLYNVSRLASPAIPKDAQVCISTIQRMYSILKGEELADDLEDQSPYERLQRNQLPVPVEYNPEYPPEFFDLILIDECHRSIFGTWRQVLEYFDAYHVGLTATPDNRALGFFNKNVVSEYSHEQAVADGVNVGGEIWTIDTEISTSGAQLTQNQTVEKRERKTRRKRWELQVEDEDYGRTDLDKSVVNPDQIRTVIQEFRDKWTDMFPGREELPKTLIFAKNNSHATDIINTVRQEFGESNEFCKKITYNTEDGDPDTLLAKFRNDYYPRIAVTVDMIATGTDVKPLECLLFMRDVRSGNYFEQMKGRGTRTYDADKLKSVTPSASTGKTHFVIVDAAGATRSRKTTSTPLVTNPTIPLKELAFSFLMGGRDEDTVSNLAGRLARLSQTLTLEEQETFAQKSNGKTLNEVCGDLVKSLNADEVEKVAKEKFGLTETDEVSAEQYEDAREELVSQVAMSLNAECIDFITEAQKLREQTIDHDNLDRVIYSGSTEQVVERASSIISDFEKYILDNQNEIDALKIYFSEPQRRAEVTFQMIKEVLTKLKSERPNLMPLHVWGAYQRLDRTRSTQPLSELTALVSLLRTICGLDEDPNAFEDTVRKNYQDWIMAHNRSEKPKFTEEQMEWLRMIRDHISLSFHIDKDDFDLSPFDSKGGLGKLYQLFGNDMSSLVDELNAALVA